MRVNQDDRGNTIIEKDDAVVAAAAGMDLGVTSWSYVDGSGQTVRIDIAKEPVDLDALARLYLRAYGSKRKEDAAAYCVHKARLLASFRRRDVLGSRYE
ncbi:hypothetical protein [Paenibacillus ehimensis]|uniref:Uncharacterized protein n=1 Tax=Paenibacillus ehimensis TaxID=79264 RepID=A0ABT8VMK0_9BACL|nr:hypothetical protein [Paenibacillus ehimensis]MDO3682210.1 hypothetical protein [Paenibacillus ehimensis]